MVPDRASFSDPLCTSAPTAGCLDEPGTTRVDIARIAADECVAGVLLDEQTKRMPSRIGQHIERFALVL